MDSPSAMELSIMKLPSPQRRSVHSARFAFDKDLALARLYGGGASPRVGSAPASPPWPPSSRRADVDDLFTIFEQHRAAVPFKWEETPGTRRHDAEAAAAARAGAQRLKEAIICSSDASSSISRSSSGGTSASSGSRHAGDDDTEDDASLELKFKFDPFEPFASNPPGGGLESGGSARMTGSSSAKSSCSSVASKSSVSSAGSASGSGRTRSKRSGSSRRNASTANLSSGGGRQMTLPLKPPPGLNSIKQLLGMEHDDRAGSGCISAIGARSAAPAASILNSPRVHARRSFRRDGLKALPFLSSSPFPKTSHGEDFLLGFEEWPKVVQQQNKLEKKEKQKEKKEKLEDDDGSESGRHIAARGRLSFSFRKKSAASAEKDAAAGAFSDPLDADAVFGEDFGKKGGLRERRPLTSVSSRGLADGYSANFRSRSWVYDSDADYSDCETDARSSNAAAAELFASSAAYIIAEEKDVELEQNTKDVGVSINSRHIGSPKEAKKPKTKKKKASRNPLTRMFGSGGKDTRDKKPAAGHQKPSRLSAVSPAPPPAPPPAAQPAQSECKSKPAMTKPQHRGASPTKPAGKSNSLLRLWISGPLGKVLFRNVRQLRTLDTHKPRVLTAK